jgi:hypothetical protein
MYMYVVCIYMYAEMYLCIYVVHAYVRICIHMHVSMYIEHVYV